MDYADRTYKIEITAKGFGGTKNTAEEVGGAGGIQNQTGGTAGGSEGSVTDVNKLRSSTPPKEKNNAKQALKQLFGFAVLKNFGQRLYGHEVSMVQLRTGSHEAQQRANLGYSVAQEIVGMAEGAVLGAQVGGVWGAIAGVAISAINTTITWTQKANTLSTQQGLETTQQTFASQRVTFSGSRYQNAGD